LHLIIYSQRCSRPLCSSQVTVGPYTCWSPDSFVNDRFNPRYKSIRGDFRPLRTQQRAMNSYFDQILSTPRVFTPEAVLIFDRHY